MKDILETRAYSVKLETREDSDMGTISGRPIVYGSYADLMFFREIIDVGALDSADLSDVRLCLNHDTSYVYARSRRNNPNSTMRLMPTALGLDIEADLAIKESAKARDYFTAIQREDIDKMSFMFSVKEDRWEDLESDYPTRHILKIGSVVEVSAVTFPAYESTEISARSKEALESARSALESARQQNAKPLESGDEINLLHEKLKLLGGI